MLKEDHLNKDHLNDWVVQVPLCQGQSNYISIASNSESSLYWNCVNIRTNCVVWWGSSFGTPWAVAMVFHNLVMASTVSNIQCNHNVNPAIFTFPQDTHGAIILW